jgi:ribosomal protein S18 acetylase RimI-like enzyme
MRKAPVRDPAAGAVIADNDLYRRGSATLLASWAAYARGATGAALRRLPGVAAAVFPAGPERTVYNNALLERCLPTEARRVAVDAMEAAYAGAGVHEFAAWVHESDAAMRADLEARRYQVVESTRAMGVALADLPPARPAVAVEAVGWTAYLRLEGLPPDFLAAADHAALHVLGARVDGELAGAALAYDHAGDCGIFNVGTTPQYRRRGLATALTLVQLHDAAARGCVTASLQSTPMAERVYAAVGMRDLGRILEYAPSR